MWGAPSVDKSGSVAGSRLPKKRGVLGLGLDGSFGALGIRPNS